MVRNVVGLFDSSSEARSAVQALRDAGFRSEDINFVANNARGSYTTGTADEAVEAERGASFGATSGAVMGGLAGLLVGLGAIAIPGIGPVIAAGSWASALASTAVGAGLGAATGGLIGALVGVGIPEEDAHVYAESVRRGSTLISVTAPSEAEADRAAGILSQFNVVDIDRRGTEYRQSGWTRFDEKASYSGPYYDDTVRSESRGTFRPRAYNYNSNEGTIERNASKLGNAVERGLDADLDNDGDVGRRDTRNNI
jgi:hypothetical protein